MTRETKIGLLVGLAFIIVIGILLSDHLKSSTESPGAPLPNVGSTVRNTVVAPGVGQAPITAVVQTPTVQPQHQVPTPRELQPATPVNDVIRIGGASSLQTQSQPAMSQTPNPNAPVVAYVSGPESQPNMPQPQPQMQQQPMQQQQQVPIRVAQNPQPNLEIRGADAPDSVISRIAAQHGMAVVTMTPNGTTQVPTAANAGGMREYTAEAGDSLSKIAQKFLGSGGKAARDAIVKVNPSLQDNPDLIVAGRTYKIPAAVAAAPPAAQPVVTAAQQPQGAPRQPAQPSQPRAASNENWYTVRAGDTLTRIAREELGDTSAIPAIIELNRDTIKNPDNLQVNTKIRLPGKSVAQAN